MKRFLLYAAALALFAGCGNDVTEDGEGGGFGGGAAVQLEAPVPVVENDLSEVVVSWDAVENAAGYAYALNDGEELYTESLGVAFNSLELNEDYTFSVYAVAAAGSGYTDSETAVAEFSTRLVYEGETYRVVKLKDGNVWMAENLRYVPEGKTPSSDPADKSGLWYSAANAEKKADPALTATKGLLYDAATVFGVDEITDENAATFEGAQGVCPEGWHIPTLTELTGLVGKCSNSAMDNLDAPYYDAAMGGAPIDVLDADGFNWTHASVVMRADNTKTGAYTVTNTPNGVEPVEYGVMSYIWGSTFYQKNAAGTNYQFYSFMSTWTNAYKRVTVAYGGYLYGFSVRCVKDKKAE